MMKKIYSFDNNQFYHATWQDRSHNQRYKHSLIFPKNTYSPWADDVNFQAIYKVIQDQYTLVDQFRCYELWHIANQLIDTKGDIIEVGVWRGGTGALLAKAAGPGSIIYLCDTFEGVVKAGEKDSLYKGGEHADTSQEVVFSLMKDLNLVNFRVVKGIFPEESSKEITSNTFKLCHIDVDVYQSAKDIFEWVWPKIVVGGVVVFDDYGFAACEGITSLVNELISELGDAFMVYNINGHGLLIKTKV